MVAYLTDFETLSLESSAEAVVLGRYLGLQISVVFFPALLTRYRFIEARIGDYEDIPAFQDDYARVSDAYHELGFPLEPYEAVPLFYTDFGVFVLSPQAVEQLAPVAQVGEQVFFSPKKFSLASFKALPTPIQIAGFGPLAKAGYLRRTWMCWRSNKSTLDLLDRTLDCCPCAADGVFSRGQASVSARMVVAAAAKCLTATFIS